jgi:hypothetical protein
MKKTAIVLAVAAVIAVAWLIYVGETAEKAEWASEYTVANNRPSLEIVP